MTDIQLGVQDLLWLLLPLLPLAAASGWYAARREQERQQAPRESNLSSEYFRGINFLLNEQPDKAIEVFTRMLEVNTETVETHLALGSLFRRRGEVERAIRIHQNLIARPALDNAQRSQALCELALDYHKAGLLDRAENLFLELAEIPAHAEQALRTLMQIYEQEKDWDKAIASGRRLARTSGRNLGPILAQYHCELAERCMQEGNMAQAHQLIGDAIALDSRCVRASVLAGRLALQEGRERDAIAAWQNIEHQDSAFLDEVIDNMAAVYRRLNDSGGLRKYLDKLARRQPGPRTLWLLVKEMRAREGVTAARAFVADRMRATPSVAGLMSHIDLHLEQGEPVTRDDLVVLRRILDQLATQQRGYQCQQCGFRGQTLHWQCPACHDWATLQPASCADGAGSGPRGKTASPKAVTDNKKKRK